MIDGINGIHLLEARVRLKRKSHDSPAAGGLENAETNE